MTTTGSYAISGLQYSVNHGTWTDVEANKGVTFGGTNGNLRLRGTNTNGTATNDNIYSTIKFTDDNVKVACTGDIRTLLDWRNYATVATDHARFCYLFSGCNVLTSAPELPAKTLADYCYSNMFSYCTSLESAPKMSAERLAQDCCEYMFRNCTSLESITIPNTVTDIYYEAFRGCTSLKSIVIPNSVKKVPYYCFVNCPSLEFVYVPASVTEIEEGAFGYREYDNKLSNFTIYGIKGTAAEEYANSNGFTFVERLFPDVASNDWYFNAVKFNAEKGYVTGYQNGTFGPSNNIQRQDFVLILARIAGADLSAYEGKNGGFSDVQAGAYYASAVAWAKDKGIVTGYSADNFGVGTYISREQISLILCRYLNGSASGDVDAILNAYSDGGNTSPWAKAGVAWAVENGIIGNSDYLNPNGNAGRAEVAQIIYNMSNKGLL